MGRYGKVVVAVWLTIELLSGCGAQSNISSDPAVAHTEQGTVRGNMGDGYVSFLGIPYAAPPVGDLRWKQPAPAPVRPQELAATATPSECVQFAPDSSVAGSEDCLYLNIYRPSKADAKSLPVLVYIHGGSLTTGQGSNTDGIAFASQNNVVLVTLNYRLNGFGFFAHPALSAEAGGSSGAYGLLDQQAALRWVKANIANFAGDPSNVTIFGQSSGGVSVVSHVASPSSAGLFAKAAVISGGWYPDTPPLAPAEARGAADATSWGCTGDDATITRCLRALPASTIVRATYAPLQQEFVPVVDGKVLTMTVEQALESGHFNSVPYMTGATPDEWALYAAPVLANAPLTAQNYDSVTAAYVSTIADRPILASDIRNLYPAANFENPTKAYVAAVGDFKIACQHLKFADLVAKVQPDVWAYQFAPASVPNYEPGMDPAYFPGPELPWFGSWGIFHTSDIQYWFEDFRQQDRTSANLNLSAVMRQYLVNFASTGNPNGTSLPNWPSLRSAPQTVLNFGAPINPSFDARTEHNCSFWENYNLQE
ncbi:carboxylesterase type B [Paraburkholderia sp. BL27I4N3]|uniref:carboxylesterase/lipase family protein n=1 Tax=Paraburkholderia sp. BL27I4N3 TaxID=1938805 RepID=UPI000E22CCE2|nr:carboxylesterase family protein [Paraburkholderia sp. BL27I4N3]REE18166.1 carboxylesterase type B [Paraburkholderia sp. BL27I4N3]